MFGLADVSLYLQIKKEFSRQDKLQEENINIQNLERITRFSHSGAVGGLPATGYNAAAPFPCVLLVYSWRDHGSPKPSKRGSAATTALLETAPPTARRRDLSVVTMAAPRRRLRTEARGVRGRGQKGSAAEGSFEPGRPVTISDYGGGGRIETYVYRPNQPNKFK